MKRAKLTVLEGPPVSYRVEITASHAEAISHDRTHYFFTPYRGVAELIVDSINFADAVQKETEWKRKYDLRVPSYGPELELMKRNVDEKLGDFDADVRAVQDRVDTSTAQGVPSDHKCPGEGLRWKRVDEDTLMCTVCFVEIFEPLEK